MDTIERRDRMRDLEYTEFYEKTRHMMGRIAKRSSIIEKAQQEEPAPDSLTQDAQAAGFTDGLEGLTPRQRQLNQVILAGRMRRQ